ncbi:MAG: hypothetical protein BWK80_63145 [Desulfobacteraceae bacterium IS3]|nr:MAG: hypothetical protein BWK80_63145 [Desulfobacteraceae bacterium IS3]
MRGEPREIALGFALGIFIGMSPTMGFQMPIAVFFAAIFRYNKVSAAMGVWITNPLSAPFLYGITYLIGAKLIGIREIIPISGEFDITTLKILLSKAPEIVWALIVGGIVTGIPLAVISYYLCYSAVQRYQDDIKRRLAKQKEKFDRKREEKRLKKEEKKMEGG